MDMSRLGLNPATVDKIARALMFAGKLASVTGAELLAARNEELAEELAAVRVELDEYRTAAIEHQCAELADVDEHQGAELAELVDYDALRAAVDERRAAADVDEHQGDELVLGLDGSAFPFGRP